METTIQKQYKQIRHLINNGDYAFFCGTGFVASTIEEADKAPVSHSGRIIKIFGRLLIIDSNAKGNHPEWLSSRIDSYDNGAKLIIIRSNSNEAIISNSVFEFMQQSDDERTKYDFRNGIKELLNRVTERLFNKRWLKIKLDNKHHICSESIRKSAEKDNIVTDDFKKLPIAFPYDYFRYRNLSTTLILFDNY